METVHQLEEDTINMLNRLIEANIDSKEGYEQAAESVDNDGLSKLFTTIAKDREAQAKQLQRYVLNNGEETEEDGTTRGSLHNSWVKFRAAINGGDEEVVLIEARRGEEHIKELYEDLLKENPGSALSSILHDQYRNVKSDYNQISHWRKMFD